MRLLIDWLIGWPERVAKHLEWLAPLFARITVGWVFLLSGWGKLHNLPQVTENFVGWGIPFPHFFTPLTSGIEFKVKRWSCSDGKGLEDLHPT